MLGRQSIKDIAERVTKLPPEAGLQLWAEQREAAQLARFDAWIGELSKSERVASGGELDLEKIVAPFLDGLGQVMQADRLVFHAAPTPHRLHKSPDSRGHALLEPVALWSRTDEGDEYIEMEPKLRLDSLASCERNLRAGFAHRASGLTGLVDSNNPRSKTRRWAPVRTALLVPCSMDGQLLGVFAIEASLGAVRWTADIVARAEFVGRLFANMLDRLRLGREVEVLRSRQAQADRLSALGQVASGVAHDFNNVLTAILGYADLLEIELGEGGKSGHAEIDEIRAAATRATRLVDHVLSFGRVREGGVQPIDLTETLEGLEGMLRRVVGNAVTADFDWAVDAEEGKRDALVVLDPEQLERAVLNLAANARDAFEDPHGTARFELSTRFVRIDSAGREASKSGEISSPPSGLAGGEYVRLTARDNGCGIDPALFERLFEPFFTTKRDHGTGLGLALCAEFVRAAGGEIRVESAPGQGSAFHLYFPLAKTSSLPANPALGSGRNASRRHSSAFDGPTIQIP